MNKHVNSDQTNESIDCLIARSVSH